VLIQSALQPSILQPDCGLHHVADLTFAVSSCFFMFITLGQRSRSQEAPESPENRGAAAAAALSNSRLSYTTADSMTFTGTTLYVHQI
jgi:hypothetical protein